MINRTSGFNCFSCRHHAAAGHLRAATCETLDFPLHSIDKGVKIPNGACHDSGFITDNAFTTRHLNPSGRLKAHSPRLLIAKRHRLRGFLP